MQPTTVSAGIAITSHTQGFLNQGSSSMMAFVCISIISGWSEEAALFDDADAAVDRLKNEFNGVGANRAFARCSHRRWQCEYGFARDVHVRFTLNFDAVKPADAQHILVVNVVFVHDSKSITVRDTLPADIPIERVAIPQDVQNDGFAEHDRYRHSGHE